MPTTESNFPLHVLDEGDRLTVRFSPGTVLSEANAEPFAGALAMLVAGKGGTHLVVDLGGVVMVTSMILTKLLGMHNQLRADGGRFTLCNPNTVVSQVFKVTRLDTVLEVLPTAHAVSA